MLASARLLSDADAALLIAAGVNLKLANLPFVTTPIDLTAVAQTAVLPPMTGYKIARGSALFMLIEKDGTITTAPTLKIGTSATHDDVCASQTVAAFTTQATHTAVTIAGVSPSNTDLDLGPRGLILDITAAAVLGTATFFRGRLLCTSLQIGAW
jgi:hypothetical protein